jgi:holo-ACP synthase
MAIETLGAGAPEAVTLEAVLANREQRTLRQRRVLAAHGLPVVSVTLVMPGPVKATDQARLLLEAALEALRTLLASRGWALVHRETLQAPTGPEALLAVAAPARDLKAAAVRLEEEHPLGRLWDLDVLDPETGPLSRRALGLGPRPCLLCGEDAHACARSRAHPLQALLDVIQEKLHAYPL